MTTDATNLFLRARKIKDVPIFKTIPYQSDYSSHWANPNDRETNIGRLDFFYKQPELRKSFFGKALDCLPSKLSKKIKTIKRKLTISCEIKQEMFQEVELD